ncbi:MAG: hypothetical protein IPM29_00660 [Planctomycetes bacterium]|nr:hypothetical protein [Planctomycetota bacterium]
MESLLADLGDVARAHAATMTYRHWLLRGRLGELRLREGVPSLVEAAALAPGAAASPDESATAPHAEQATAPHAERASAPLLDVRPLLDPEQLTDAAALRKRSEALLAEATVLRRDHGDVVGSDLRYTAARIIDVSLAVAAPRRQLERDVTARRAQLQRFAEEGLEDRAAQLRPALEQLELQLAKLAGRGALIEVFADERRRWGGARAGVAVQFEHGGLFGCFVADLAAQPTAHVVAALKDFVAASITLQTDGDRSFCNPRSAPAARPLGPDAVAALEACTTRAKAIIAALERGDRAAAQTALDAVLADVLAFLAPGAVTALAMPRSYELPYPDLAVVQREVSRYDGLLNELEQVGERFTAARLRARRDFLLAVQQWLTERERVRADLATLRHTRSRAGAADGQLDGRIADAERRLEVLEQPTRAALSRRVGTRGLTALFCDPGVEQSPDEVVRALEAMLATLAGAPGGWCCAEVDADVRRLAARCEPVISALREQQLDAARSALDEMWSEVLATQPGAGLLSSAPVAAPADLAPPLRDRGLTPLQRQQIAAWQWFAEPFRRAASLREASALRVADVRADLERSRRRGDLERAARLEAELAAATATEVIVDQQLCRSAFLTRARQGGAPPLAALLAEAGDPTLRARLDRLRTALQREYEAAREPLDAEAVALFATVDAILAAVDHGDAGDAGARLDAAWAAVIDVPGRLAARPVRRVSPVDPRLVTPEELGRLQQRIGRAHRDGDQAEAWRLLAKMQYLESFVARSTELELARQRIGELRQELAQRQRFGEAEQVQRIQDEIARLTADAALGLTLPETVFDTGGRLGPFGVFWVDPADGPELRRALDQLADEFRNASRPGEPTARTDALVRWRDEIRALRAQLDAGELDALRNALAARRAWVLGGG